MPGCSTCGKVWPDGFNRCPDDGSVLMPGGAPSPSVHGNAAPAYAPQSDEDLAAGSLAGEYRIEKKLGEGGMGSVYGARHPLIGKRAAIKVIRRELSTNQEAVDRFVLEAQSVNQIGHPNIVDVFGFGQLPDGRSFFVMEWLDGESLRERLQRPLPFPEALEMLETIAKALQAAHDAGVVHRDLKPDNVFLQVRKHEKAQVKLLDFGLAKLTGQGDGRMDRTRTGVVMGTPLYLSPEQAKGQKIDAATDVYSLGAMAYEMLAGVVPFKADSAVEIMAMHISARATPLMETAPWVPPEINELVLQMLEKDAARRPTAEQVRERIAMCRARTSVASMGALVNPSTQPAAWTPGTPMSAPYMTPAPSVPTPSPHVPTPYPGAPMQTMAPAPARSNKGLIAIIAVAALAALGGVAFFVMGKGDDKPAPVAATAPEPTQPAEPPAATPPAPTPPAPTPPVPAATPETSIDASVPVDSGSAENLATTTPPDTTKPVVTKPDVTKPDVTKPDVTRPKRGRVTVVFSGPPRALVIIDGKPQGREASGRVTVELAPGEHTVRVQAKGYKPATTTVRVDAGGARDVALKLEKKTSVNAVHDPFAD